VDRALNGCVLAPELAVAETRLPVFDLVQPKSWAAPPATKRWWWPFGGGKKAEQLAQPAKMAEAQPVTAEEPPEAARSIAPAPTWVDQQPAAAFEPLAPATEELVFAALGKPAEAVVQSLQPSAACERPAEEVPAADVNAGSHAASLPGPAAEDDLADMLQPVANILDDMPAAAEAPRGAAASDDDLALQALQEPSPPPKPSPARSPVQRRPGAGWLDDDEDYERFLREMKRR
jgi:hypothetical protein